MKTVVLSAWLLIIWGAPLARAQEKEKNRPVAEEKILAQVIELTNRERVTRGLLPLRVQANLSASARWMAQDMAVGDYMDHADSKDRNIDTRLPAFGYKEYHYLGENIAAGQQTPTQVVATWMRSPGHRANILNPSFSEIGVGYAGNRSSRLRYYWVQDFGSRFDVFPVVINNSEEQTGSASVKLSIYGQEWAREMRLSNDGERWTSWQRFRARLDWTLGANKGKQTLYVELRNENKTHRAEATILVIEEPPPPVTRVQPDQRGLRAPE